MKAVKVILLIGFLALIGFLIYSMVGEGGISGPGLIGDEKNQFIEEIDRKIDSLANQPESTFSHQIYEDIHYRITDFANQQHFGQTESENNQVSESLHKTLYSTYAPKFVAQAKYVFSRSEWKVEELNLIRAEMRELSNSPYLESRSDMSNSFAELRSILAKYDEISAFVISCKNFSVPVQQLDNQFPDVTDKIQRSEQYLSANLENAYVNNCTRLKEDLRNVRQYLSDNNYNYLLEKIHYHGGRYTEFSKTSDFQNAITRKLKNEVASFKQRFPLGNHRQLTNLIKEYEVKADDYM